MNIVKTSLNELNLPGKNEADVLKSESFLKQDSYDMIRQSVANNSIEGVKVGIAKAKTEDPDDTYRYPVTHHTIFRCIEKDQTEIVELLLSIASDEEKRIIGKDDNVFSYAVIKRDTKSVKLLLKETPVDIHENNEYSLRHLSQISYADKELEMFKILVEHGADISYNHNEVIYRLINSVQVDRNKETVKFLIKKGADLNDAFIHHAGKELGEVK